MKSWILTSTGREQDLTLGAAVPSIDEIAHSLAQINRFTGHALRPYSVAEHSVLVSRIIKIEFGEGAHVQFAGLMHDAHECLCGDMATPIKQLIGPGWKEFESTWEYAIHQHFGLVDIMLDYKSLIKKADLIALATERRDLMKYDAAAHRPWPILEGIRPLKDHIISPHELPWTRHREAFLDTYTTLSSMVDSGWGALV